MSESSGHEPPDRPSPHEPRPEGPGSTVPPGPPSSPAPPSYPPPSPGGPSLDKTGPPSPGPPAPAPYGAPPPGQYGAPYPAAKTNTKATVSLVCGIGSIVLGCFPLGIPGLITGFSARREIRHANGAETGDGLAVAGIVTSFIGLLVVGCLVGSVLAVMLLGQSADVKFSSVGSAIR